MARLKQLLLAMVAGLALLAPAAFADLVKTATLNSTTAKTVSYDTAGYQVATVDVSAASGSPDGTVQIYVNEVSVGTGGVYATPTTKKSFRGPVTGTIRISLTGNSTGTVAVTVTLK